MQLLEPKSTTHPMRQHGQSYVHSPLMCPSFVKLCNMQLSPGVRGLAVVLPHCQVHVWVRPSLS